MAEDRIKVFYFIPSLAQGGAERQILELIRRLPERFEPVLALYHDTVYYKDLLPPGQPRYVLGGNRMTPAAFRTLVAALRAEQPTIFHSYLDRANFWGRLAAWRAGVPVVISSCRARMMEPHYLLAERVLSRRADLVIANSVGIERELCARGGVAPDKLRVVHNFIDLDHFRPPSAAERAAARQQWSIAAGRRVLLMPGRIALQKHQIGMLLAIGQLARRGALPPEALFLFPGRGRGAWVDQLVDRLADDAALRDQVRLLGSQKDIRSLYWAADVLVLPSLWEGLPNAALEGAACGLPVLASHSANLDQIVDHGLSGWEVPTGDHRGLARLLAAEVFPRRRPELQRMGARGRSRMEALFSPERPLAQLLALYDQQVARKLGADAEGPQASEVGSPAAVGASVVGVRA